MLEDLGYHRLVFYETEDPRLPLALGADKGINLVDFPDEPSPTLFRSFQ